MNPASAQPTGPRRTTSGDPLDSLTLLEAAQLNKLLQEKWGVSAAAVAVAAGPAAPVAAAMPRTISIPAMINTNRLKMARLALFVQTSTWANRIGPNMLVARQERLKKPKN